MRVDDRTAGIVAIVLGAAVAAAARSFPPALGQPVGPAAFPTAIGVALIVCGLILLKMGTLNISARDQPEMLSIPVFAVLGSVVFYALALGWLGFLPTATLLLSVLFAVFGVPRGRILPLALVVTLGIHFVFYTLLRVPLPWGLLEGFAW